LIASLLSVQSRTMATLDGRAQLDIAARRVVALGTVHHRLHLADQAANVEFKEFLIGLCGDLSDLLFKNRTDQAIVVEATKVEIPSSLASALGLSIRQCACAAIAAVNRDAAARCKASKDRLI
jgi:two-component sensor histidine kinase